ncbi:Para-hydroxybenzoate--polyprenyltransferase, mitochondrial precursor (PHB:polyprenyltransferase) [Physocladia obscura]|uniref:Para-hydroxybenzoate--polyprenyltransferase, mitochondrial (PHB:polyprenyltransferase) n=1 Tax=Physocladia obscura TaxID=109957 RepID=A0AAD5T6M1_9FUNG|nr:Para-hydroxybenzoate--polyprenyltransferase, mitochondrial precursor (PHB:polyprenyltransferase) [Physocladia obscura]
MTQAFFFLAFQASLGLAVLLQLNFTSILLGASSLLLVVLYPAIKRVSHWPQAVLGLTFNWGALLGWTAIAAPPTTLATIISSFSTLNLSTAYEMATASIAAPAVCLYLAGWSWTLVYDTIYALQDARDDERAGVKSTALLFGKSVKPILAAFAGTAVAFFALAGFMNGNGLCYYVVSVGGAAAHFWWLVGGLQRNQRQAAAARFRAAPWLGWIVFGGIVLDYLVLLASRSSDEDIVVSEEKIVNGVSEKKTIDNRSKTKMAPKTAPTTKSATAAAKPAAAKPARATAAAKVEEEIISIWDRPSRREEQKAIAAKQIHSIYNPNAPTAAAAAANAKKPVKVASTGIKKKTTVAAAGAGAVKKTAGVVKKSAKAVGKAGKANAAAATAGDTDGDASDGAAVSGGDDGSAVIAAQAAE